eukprot:TRINITY_DN2852_c0_g1_i1.p1 TRINITY_DN2852_c0_g1~~TRINITY_DN2852_c0_g1_i1.p1  ORF type:complete len:425 (-),score=85.06 TRINITY_DN2852_c0_g1_i1:35-1309(-)
MHKFRVICRKGEGTFSEVLKAQCIKDGEYVAIKRMKGHFASVEQVNNLREIQALRRLNHPNIIKLLEVLYDRKLGRLALVFELMEMNIYELIRTRRHYLSEKKIQKFLYLLLKSIDFSHRNGIFHRDIKPENILLSNTELKLADYGSCRSIYSEPPFTEYISTRWYRAPECLLTDGYYNYKMDIWGAGCVFFEIAALFPLFPGSNELDQIHRIHDVLGTPPRSVLDNFKKNATHMSFDFPIKKGTGIKKLAPHLSDDALDLLTKMLAYVPGDRISARQALKHPFFRDLRNAEATPQIPTPMNDESLPQMNDKNKRSKSSISMHSVNEKLPQLGISTQKGSTLSTADEKNVNLVRNQNQALTKSKKGKSKSKSKAVHIDHQKQHQKHQNQVSPVFNVKGTKIDMQKQQGKHVKHSKNNHVHIPPL